MATNLRQFDARPLVERIKARHGLSADAKVGIFGCFDTKAAMDTERGNNDVVAMASTDGIDLDEEVVLPEGGDLSYVTTNRKLFVDHCYDIEYAVASLRSITAVKSGGKQRGWSIRSRLLQGDIHKAARIVESICQQDGIGMSIGFIADDAGRPDATEAKAYPGAKSIVRKWKMLEISFTCLPCNVSCQTMAGTQDGSKSAKLRESFPIAATIFDLPLPVLEFTV